jgi:hypothetical protein
MNNGKGDIILACSLMEDEVNLAVKNTGCGLPIVWLEGGLHEYPNKLKEAIQDSIESICSENPQVETILLCYGLCGNALDGVGCKKARLVVPRFHDCIQMNLAFEEKQPVPMDIHSLYYTRGFIRGKQSFINSYKGACEKYGTQKARSIYRDRLFSGYRSVTLLDNGAYPVGECTEEPKNFAEIIGKEFKINPGTIRVLEKLLLGRWDEEFCIIEKGGLCTAEQFFTFPCRDEPVCPEK